MKSSLSTRVVAIFSAAVTKRISIPTVIAMGFQSKYPLIACRNIMATLTTGMNAILVVNSWEAL